MIPRLHKVKNEADFNKFYAMDIDQTRSIFPITGHVQESLSTLPKFLDCQGIPKSGTCPCRAYFDPSLLRILCDVTGHILRSDENLFKLFSSMCSALRCIHLASCHYYNYSCLLVMLILVFYNL